MKIKTKQSIEREVEIVTPFFRKQINSTNIEYLGMIDEKNVIYWYANNDGTYINMTSCEAWVKETEVVRAFETWQEVSEYEFLQAHEDTLQSLSLRPKLVNQDDLKEINI